MNIFPVLVVVLAILSLLFYLNGYSSEHPISFLSKLEALLAEYFGKKLPALPKRVKEIIKLLGAPMGLLLGIFIPMALLEIVIVLPGMDARSVVSTGFTLLDYVWALFFGLFLIQFGIMCVQDYDPMQSRDWNSVYYTCLIKACSVVVSFLLLLNNFTLYSHIPMNVFKMTDSVQVMVTTAGIALLYVTIETIGVYISFYYIFQFRHLYGKS